jgi:hypothetical protein
MLVPKFVCRISSLLSWSGVLSCFLSGFNFRAIARKFRSLSVGRVNFVALHDLRHTALTKMAEAGVPESTMLALAGHMSRAMLERYSHIRMAAKREAVEALSLSRKPAEPATVVPTESANSDGVPTKVPTVGQPKMLQ